MNTIIAVAIYAMIAISMLLMVFFDLRDVRRGAKVNIRPNGKFWTMFSLRAVLGLVSLYLLLYYTVLR